MNENETTRTEPAETVGDIMTEAKREAIKRIVLLLGALVYLGGLVYAEVHGLNILTKGINPEMQIWATLGMIALGISAVALPLALHVWTFDAMHRIAALVFYAIDIALLGINAFTDFNVNVGQRLAPWAQTYMTYVLPMTPVIAALGWSVLWLLDPATRALVLRQTLRASILEAKARQIANAARADGVSATVRDAAEREVHDALSELFGKPVKVKRYEHAVPSPVITKPATQEDAKPAQDAPFPGGVA